MPKPYLRIPVDKRPEIISEYLRGVSRKELAEKYGVGEGGLKALFRRLDIKLPDSVRSQQLSAAGKKSYATRVEKGTLRYGDINSEASIAKRAKTRRENEACRRGHGTIQERYERLAASHGGTVAGDFAGVYSPLTWTCAKSHTWVAAPKNLLTNGAWCPSCAHVGPSRGQLEVAAYIQSLIPGEEVRVGDRQKIGPLELDVYVPGREFALEYNGLIFHSEYFGDNRGRHRRKALACRAAGVHLLAIFEDEWQDPGKNAIIRAMIRHRLGVATESVGARELEVRYLEKNTDFEAFFEGNHLDGHALASWAVGLFAGPELVSCLSIRQNFNAETEIGRLATDHRFHVPGAASRLLAAVRRRYRGDLYSFSNNRLSTGNTYEKLGFQLVSEGRQSYWYTDGFTRVWRYRCRRDNSPEAMAKAGTEAGQALAGVFSQKLFGDDRPLYRIEDYGHRKWILVDSGHDQDRDQNP